MTAVTAQRWFRYRLQTLFVVITVFGCWLGYELNWIRQRRAAIGSPEVTQMNKPSIRAPGMLWLFGEPGYAVLFRKTRGGPFARPAPEDERDLARLAKLFPEAKVGHWVESRLE